jgi:hypothetical protein
MMPRIWSKDQVLSQNKHVKPASEYQKLASVLSNLEALRNIASQKRNPALAMVRVTGSEVFLPVSGYGSESNSSLAHLRAKNIAKRRYISLSRVRLMAELALQGRAA